MALKLNAQANETTLVYNGSVTLQQNMVALVTLLEHDFRQIGYCKTFSKIPDPSQSIRKADTSDITFWTDVNNNGNLDSVRWYIGPTSELSSTPNPRDRKIYRVVNNGTPVGWILGVTQFKLEYYEFDGDTIKVLPVANPGSIFSMRISLACESPVPFVESYRTQTHRDSLTDFQVFWRQLRLASRNLKNR
jgi:hypothetical protein